MQENIREMTVAPEHAAHVIRDADSKGWYLLERNSTPDGQERLRFAPRGAMQLQATPQAPGYGSHMPMGAPRVDPNTAWLELLGLLGFLGIGYLVAGRTNDGIIRLVGFLGVIFVAWTIAGVLRLVLIGFCLMPFIFLAQIAIPIWSALELKKVIEAQNANNGYPMYQLTGIGKVWCAMFSTQFKVMFIMLGGCIAMVTLLLGWVAYERNFNRPMEMFSATYPPYNPAIETLGAASQTAISQTMQAEIIQTPTPRPSFAPSTPP